MKSPRGFFSFLLLLPFLFLSSPLSSASFFKGSISAGGSDKASVRASILNLSSRSVSANLSSSEKLRAPGIAKSPAGADPAYVLGEVYAFPNPSKRDKKPTLHAEVGIADSIEFRMYDVSGELVHKIQLDDLPQIVDDGQGPQYAYEYAWEGAIPSGIYLCVAQAHKKGEKDLTALVRLAVIR